MSFDTNLLIFLIVFFIGLLSGLLIGAVMWKRNTQADVRKEVKTLREENVLLREEKAAAKSRLQADTEHYNRELEQLRRSRAELLNEFRDAAAGVLEQRQKQLHEENTRQLGGILRPLEQQLGQFRNHLQQIRSQDAQERGFLRKELEQLMELNQHMSSEARDLTEALKGSNKTMGSWGELVLKRVLESSGLREGQEFFLQKEFSGTDGNRLRPDAVIQLPGERMVIIDAKASLLAYERSLNAVTEDEREAHGKKHLESIRRHLKSLDAKAYERIPEIRSPDFILMFVPVEAALASALQLEPGLFQTALQKRILLVSPGSLYLSLRIIEQMWKGDRQYRNARIIAEKAGALHDKFEGFLRDLQTVGSKIQDAGESWEASMNKLSRGKGNLIRRAAELKELGAESRKTLPGEDADR